MTSKQRPYAERKADSSSDAGRILPQNHTKQKRRAGGVNPYADAKRLDATTRELVGGGLAGAEGFFDFGYVARCIDGDAFIGAFGDANVVTVFQPAELFELFKALELAGRQRGKLEKRITAKDVEANVLEMARGDAFAGVADPGNGRARKIKRVAVEIEDDFDDIGIHDFGRMGNRSAERSDLRFRLRKNFVHRGIDGFRRNERFITLHVDVNLGGNMDGDFGDALCTGAVLAARHDGFAAKTCNGVADAVIVGRHDDAGNAAGHFRAFDDVLNHGASSDRRQGLAGKTRRVIARGNHHDNGR